MPQQTLQILFENNNFIAVNKPSGMLSIPDRQGKAVSVKTLLQQRMPSVYTVHRLDRLTDGIIVFAKNEATFRALSLMFEHRKVEKYYLGWVQGTPIPDYGEIIAPIMESVREKGTMIIHTKGKPSHTSYRVLESFKHYSLIRFQIHSGRTHQIRVHSKYIGHPIVCDALYGDGMPVFISSIKKNYNLAKKEDEEKPIIARVALHASQIKFTLNGELFAIESPMPKDFKALLQQLRKWTSSNQKTY